MWCAPQTPIFELPQDGCEVRGERASPAASRPTACAPRASAHTLRTATTCMPPPGCQNLYAETTTRVWRVTTVDHGECCGRRLVRGHHCDLSELRTLAPAPLLVLVLLLVLAAAPRSCSSCCASPRHQLIRSESDSRRSARGLGCQCSRAIRWVRPTAPSPSARALRPPSRPRLPNAGPAHILAQSPTPAPRARATRRACLVSADASRRDVQIPPRSICHRDGSHEREPQTCAIAHRLLHLLHRSMQTYAWQRQNEAKAKAAGQELSLIHI